MTPWRCTRSASASALEWACGRGTASDGPVVSSAQQRGPPKVLDGLPEEEPAWPRPAGRAGRHARRGVDPHARLRAEHSASRDLPPRPRSSRVGLEVLRLTFGGGHRGLHLPLGALTCGNAPLAQASGGGVPHAVVTVVDHGCERPRAASVMPPAAVEPGRLGPIDLPFRPFRSAPQLPRPRPHAQPSTPPARH